MTSNINGDWQTIQTVITGLGSTVAYARYEYTAGPVSDYYLQQISVLAELFNRPSPATITDQDAANVYQALGNLYNLATNGMVIDGKTWAMSTDMAGNFDQLARTLYASGFYSSFPALPVMGTLQPGLDTTTNNVQALQAWKDLSITSPVIGQLLKTGLDIQNTNRTLQAMIELDYVKTANGLVNDKLGSLETALAATSDILNTLAAVQDIHNQISVSSKSGIGFSYLNQSSSAKDYLNNYLTVASQYFGKAISVDVAPGMLSGIASLRITHTTNYSFQYVDSTGLQHNGFTTYAVYSLKIVGYALSSKGNTYVDNLLKLKASITSELSRLDGILTSVQKTATGSIYAALVAVQNDLNSKLAVNGVSLSDGASGATRLAAFGNWVLDGYNDKDTSAQGNIQGNITKAITSAQSLNDTQKEDVRNYLFVFEEYYKSASAMLQSISQIIQKMAQGARGS